MHKIFVFKMHIFSKRFPTISVV